MRRTPVRAALLFVVLAAAPATGQSPEREPKPAKAPDDELMALLADAKADAVRIRGLEFEREPPARRITPDEFLEITMRDVHRVFGKGERFTGMQELLGRLGVIPAETDLEALIRRFFPATVAAKYDPFEGEILFLRRFRSKSVMVHELVHALQDQHYNLLLHFDSGEMTFDRLLALGALVEGDAEDVQRIFDTGGFLLLTPISVIRSTAEEQVARYLARMKDFPHALARPFIFQYLDGLLFVETVKRTRGAGFTALNSVYLDPPVTTEQILHPERYLDRDRPTTILPPPPPDGWRVSVSNVLGELGTEVVLASGLGETLDPAATAGWDGDRIQLLARDDGNPPALVWYTTWDSPADAREFATAAGAWFRARRPDVAIEEDGDRRIQRAAGAIHAIVAAGRDVFLAEGLPEEGSPRLIDHLLRAEKRELRVTKSAFGEK